MKCQNCENKDLTSKDYPGCYTCGGYGVVFVQQHCPTCQQTYWTRPGNYTRYDGKIFFSTDGLKIICSLDGKDRCGRCEK